MHIFLYGLPGSGKSTVGVSLAQALNRPFLDLDQEIELEGMPISQIMADQGEEAFRNVESEMLEKAVSGADKVISLGGGALLKESNRFLAESTGRVVMLDTEIPTLIARLSRDANQRPLLAGNLKDKLKNLINDRKVHYDSFSMRVDGSRQPEDVVWEIQRLLGCYHVTGMGQGYDVIVLDDGMINLEGILNANRLGNMAMVVSDSNVAPLYLNRVVDSLKRSGIEPHSLIIPAGENYKTLETVSDIWSGFLDAGLDRTSTVIALGGGVVGDLVGFAASTYMRGVSWVNIPTTLLSMIDASIGGKTGFDLPQGKNLIGSFYSPRLVLILLETLKTLPDVELRSGMAEVVKHGVIADPSLFEDCSKGFERIKETPGRIVRPALAVKIQIIEKDPYETNIRAALNFGHTIGHAVELVSGFKLRHGEAVSIGMVAESRLAERLSLADKGFSEMLMKTLAGLNLPVKIPDYLPRSEIIHTMRMDKKKAQRVVRFALPVRIGEVRVGVEIENLEDVL